MPEKYQEKLDQEKSCGEVLGILFIFGMVTFLTIYLMSWIKGIDNRTKAIEKVLIEKEILKPDVAP